MVCIFYQIINRLKIHFQNDEKCEAIHEVNKNKAEEEDYEYPSKNTPSYLIWSIFRKQRKLQKASTLKKKMYTSAGNRESIQSKSAPARFKLCFD